MSKLKVDQIQAATTGGTLELLSPLSAGTIGAGVTIHNDALKRNVADGVAPLDSNGLVPAVNLRPALVPEIAADNTALAALTVVSGDIGKRLVHVTATGITWLAMTAGSGSDKWMPYSSEPAASTSAPGIVQLAATADAETNELKALTIAEFLRRLGPYRNALAPAQANTFPGDVMNPFNGPVLGAGDFSVDLDYTGPLTTNVGFLGGYAGALGLWLGTNGIFVVHKEGSGTVGTSSVAALPNVPNRFTYVRQSGVGTVYLNKTAIGTFADTNNYSTQQSFVGRCGDIAFCTGILRLLGIYNYALSQAQITLLNQTNAVAATDINVVTNSAGIQVGASNTSIIVGDDSTFANDTLWWSRSGVTVTGGKAVFTTGGQMYRNGLLKKGSVYTLSFPVSNYTGGSPSPFIVQCSGVTILTVTSNGTKTITFTANGTDLQFYSQNATADLDDVTLIGLGAAVAPEANPTGNGSQLKDMSGNTPPADTTLGSGVGWTLPDTRPNSVRATLSWSGTFEPKSLIGSNIGLPLGAFVTAITIKASTASSGTGAAIGDGTGGARFAAAQTFSTAKKALTVANGGFPSSSAAVNRELSLTPDSSAYTGTIQVEVFYSNSLGS